MNILYFVSAAGNQLYEGRYELYGRYMTYGQQSFIYDLVVGLSRRGENVTLAVESADRFPLTEPLRRYCRVIDPVDTVLPEAADLILLDEGADRLLSLCPPGVPAFRIVHNSSTPFSDQLVDRCQRFICLTESSMARMCAHMPETKLALIHQGVDVERFQPKGPWPPIDMSQIRVLIYSRIDSNREATIWRLLEELESSGMRITLLGDGERFWAMNDRYGDSVTLVHFIPCTSIQHFLPNFDVVISSARGVMEGLALGLPALCGGFEYAGPVLRSNIEAHLRVNITGFGMGVDPGGVVRDVREAVAQDRSACRQVAEEYCSVQRFIDRLFEERSAVGREAVECLRGS